MAAESSSSSSSPSAKFLALRSYGYQSVLFQILVQEMHDYCLPDNGNPEPDALVLAHAEELAEMVLVGLYYGVGLSGKYIGQMVHFEILFHGVHQFQYCRQIFLALEELFRVQAVVAVAAVLLGVVFSEIVEQNLSPAPVGLGVGYGLQQQLFSYLLLGQRLALHEFLQFQDVLVAVECDALSFLSVSAGTSGLLVVALEALGDVIVNHEPYVGFVYAHAEGYGRHYDVHLLHEEHVLVLGPGGGVHAGVIGQGLDAVDVEEFGYLLGLFPAEAVDDAGLALILLDEADHLFLDIDLVADLVVEIGPVERALEHLCVHHAEILLYVRLDFRSGGGGEGYDGCRAELVHDTADMAVFRTEIMSPFGNTVSLVYGVERDMDLPEKGDSLLLCQ